MENLQSHLSLHVYSLFAQKEDHFYSQIGLFSFENYPIFYWKQAHLR